MTIYAFYYKKINPRYAAITMGYSKMKPYLYAYTLDKKIAEEFKKQRNMNNFIFIKEDSVSKKDLTEFESINKKRELGYRSYVTYGEDKEQKITAKVLSTFDEEEAVYRDAENIFRHFSNRLFDIRFLKDKFIKPMQKLMYVDFYLFFQYNYIEDMDSYYKPYAIGSGFGNNICDASINVSYAMDYLKILLALFKDTFYEVSQKEEEEEADDYE